MNRIMVKSKVGSDGFLNLSVPVWIVEAEREVKVTVEPIGADAAMTRKEWREWVDSMTGSWQGDFERPPQGEYEEREPLS